MTADPYIEPMVDVYAQDVMNQVQSDYRPRSAIRRLIPTRNYVFQFRRRPAARGGLGREIRYNRLKRSGRGRRT